MRWSSSKSTDRTRLLEKAETELGALSQRLSRRWGLSGSALNAGLRFNPRLSRSVARYRRETGVIELGPRFFRLRSRRKEVLCHELAHVAVDYLYGKQVQPHGSEWRKLVESAGFTPAARLPATPALREEERVGTSEDKSVAGLARSPTTVRDVYEHRCPVCQMSRRAKRPVSQWRCANCVAAGLPGTLEITRMVRR